MKQSIKIFATCVAMTLGAVSAGAQDSSNLVRISGKIVDADGNPVVGAVIRSSNKGAETMSNVDGEYTITVNDGSKKISVSYVNTPTRTISVKDAALNGFISMGEPSGPLDEIIDMGYMQVTRRELTCAVSTVSGSVLEKSPESNLGKTFAGRLPGLTVMESKGEPGLPAASSTSSSVSLIVRGLTTLNGHTPLMIIDGQVCPNFNYVYITPEEIESVTVLKDASALAIYGMQGGNGAVVITTKKGKAGVNRVRVYVDEALEQVTKSPMFVNSGLYARMRNQAGYNDGLGLYSQFSQNDIDNFDSANGIYPNNDWYGRLFKKTMWMTRAGLSFQGGNDRLKYYANVNYMHQNSPFNTEKNDAWKYNPAPRIDRFNFRSNIDVKINKWLGAMMRISGSVNSVKSAGEENADVYDALFKLPPTMWGPTVPGVSPFDTSDTPAALDGAGQVVTIDGISNPVYGMLNRSGFIQTLKADISAQGGLIADIDPYVKGLKASAIVAYQTSSSNQSKTTQDYQRWVVNPNADGIGFNRLGTEENTPLSYSKVGRMYYNLNLTAFVNYKRDFGKHYVNAMAYILYQDRQTENISGSKILPYKRESTGISATYGFMGRYFVRGDFAYSGSEQFHPDHRWYSTPAISASWIASEESFMQPLDPYLSLLKFRFSYGLNDNDRLGDDRMLYADYVDFEGNQEMRGNPLIAPEKIRKINYGVDLGLFNNDLSVSFDYYNFHCDNVLISSSSLVPSFQGVPMGYFPMVNQGRVKNHGFEIAAMYTKAMNKNFSFFIGGSYSYNKNTVIDVKELSREDYAYPYEQKGQSIGQRWGYKIDYSNGNGFYNFKDEITASGLDYSAVGTVRPGDFRYKDLNGDGKIDAKDKAPIGYSNVPRGYYSVNAGFVWKDFELSFLFQGTAKRSIVLSGVGSYEGVNQGVFSDIHMNAWTEEKWAAGEQIDYPALSLGKTSSHVANDYFIQDGSYLRLKNAEIAYNMPKKICSAIRANKIRFALNGQNLFTIDHLRSKHIDPEIGSLSEFPVYRIINLGVKVEF